MPASKRKQAATLAILSVAPLALSYVGTVTGLIAIGSKYLGAAWAFAVILAFYRTKIPGWVIVSAFVAALAADHLVYHYVLLPMIKKPDEVLALAITETLMMGGACALGLLVGGSARKKRG